MIAKTTVVALVALLSGCRDSEPAVEPGVGEVRATILSNAPPAPCAPSDASATDGSTFVPGRFPQLSLRPLTADELRTLRCSDLYRMRDEVLARHGYRFKTREAQDRFAAEPWYKPIHDKMNKELLNPVEQSNLALLATVEQARACAVRGRKCAVDDDCSEGWQCERGRCSGL